MALIPTRESKQDLTTTPGIAPRSADVAGVPGKVTQVIGETLKAVSDQFQKARTLEEVTKADTEATKRISEIQLEAAQDPDVWSEQKYRDKISKVKTEASKGISIPNARNIFQAGFEKDAIAADFNIRKTLHTRQIDSMKASMLENIDALGDSYVDASTPEEQKLIEFKRDSIITNNIQLGVIDKEAAFIYKEKIKKQWQESDIRSSIATDAQLAREMLLSGDFKDLSADETAKWTEVADKKIARNKNVAETARDQMWLDNEAIIMENLEETSAQDIIEAFTQGNISPEVASAMVDAKTDPKLLPNQYETDKKVYMEMARDLVVPEQDLRVFMKKIAKGVKDGKIQFNEAAEFSVQVKGLFKSAIKFKSQPSRKELLIGTAIDTFTDFASRTADPISTAYRMTKELVNKVKSGQVTEENVEEVGQGIIEDAQKVMNPNRAKYKINEIVTNPRTGKSMKITGFDEDGEPTGDEIIQ